jgi:hypothetical protein
MLGYQDGVDPDEKRVAVDDRRIMGRIDAR